MGHYDRFMPSVAYDFYDLPEGGITLRGPIPDFDAPFTAFWGSSEVFGKFVPRDACQRLSASLDAQVVNFGIMHAGTEVFEWRGFFAHWSRLAQHNIIQTLPARNRCNRFYKVHPIRNDRLIKVSHDLTRMFPEVNFLEIYFVGHLWEELYKTCHERYQVLSDVIEEEGQQAFAHLLRHAPVGTTVVHIDGPAFHASTAPHMPHLIYEPSRDVLLRGQLGMIYHEFEREAACRSLSAAAHEELAQMLEGRVQI